jgi:hypothetical protein
VQPGITLNAPALAYLNANIGNTIILGGSADPLYGNIAVATLSPFGLALLGAFCAARRPVWHETAPACLLAAPSGEPIG